MTKKKIILDIKDSLLASTLHGNLKANYELVSDTGHFDICLSDTANTADNTIVLSTPIRLGEVLDRIESMLASVNAKDIANDISIGVFLFSPKVKTLKCKNKKVTLTEKETDMLLYLYKKQGGVVQRQELLEHVWKYNTDINTRTLETHIYRLRQKITDISDGGILISTEESGYKLNI